MNPAILLRNTANSLVLLFIAFTLLSCKKTEECDDTAEPNDVIKFDFIGKWIVEYEDNVFPIDTVEIIQGNNQYEFLLLNYRQSEDIITLYFADGEIDDIGNSLRSYFNHSIDFLDEKEFQWLNIANHRLNNNVYITADIRTCSGDDSRVLGQLVKI